MRFFLSAALAIALLLMNTGVHAEPVATSSEGFAEALEALKAGDCSTAMETFQELAEVSVSPGPALYYNMGLCYYKESAYGKAVWSFLKSGLLSDGDLAARSSHNVEVVREVIREANREAVQKGAVKAEGGFGAWHAVVTLLPIDLLAAILVLCGLLCSAGLLLWRLGPAGRLRSASVAVLLSLVLPLVASTVLYAGRVSMDNELTVGVVVVPDARLLEVPTGESRGSLLLEGLQVRILDSNEAGYYRVLVAGQWTGYVGRDQVWPLKAPEPL